MQSTPSSPLLTHPDNSRDKDNFEEDGASLGEMWAALSPHFKKVLAAALVAGICGNGISMLLPPTYTAKSTIVSPQQQSSAASALASLGALAGVGGSSAVRSPADQYISIMQSATVSNRIVERFKLVELYDVKFVEDARKRLADNVRIVAGKKDSLIFLEIDDRDPARAAEMANAYVTELRQVTNNLALTEAQQRRVFFEQQLLKTKESLKSAQVVVQGTGFTAGALKSEPKAAAEAYARAKAAMAATEVKLEALRRTLTDSAPEVQQQQAVLTSLKGQLAAYERPLESDSNQDYISAYREFKYQEALFEIYAKQFELARMDEAREGAYIQVLDPAVKPERRSKPKRSFIAAGTFLAVGFMLSAFYIVTGLRRRSA